MPISRHCIHLTGASAPIAVGKIVCLARNYVAHAQELGNEVPAEPVLFIKPASSLLADGGQIRIPPYSSDCHHEVELALLIGRSGQAISAANAMELVSGYGVALDMTLRDTQNRLKAKGLPWELAKGFDTACPLSDFVPAAQVSDPQQLRIQLRVNGELRQDGCSDCMIHRIPQLLSFISQAFTLEPGDIVLTGTPAGVGPVVSGDVLEASIDQVGQLRVSVA